MTTKQQINQQLDNLNETQLKEVAEFINTIKIREKLNQSQETLAQLYQEFTEEDRELAEIGINEYTESLKTEDLL